MTDFSKGIASIPNKIRNKYEIHEWKHAASILQLDFLSEWRYLIDVLNSFDLKCSSILEPGGRKSPIAISVNGMFEKSGWKER
ncbi:MAG: hypothetical protein A2161_03190 [Candidatus Schekmanbacteria bacterium RBG_13_48_7]|uniref:Uncharacterized protein n=1 Tax=Candidatus Schekmanbacteria bacterium RBG_13_48_7 TaxID=1817878 RepID=A0A1F7RRQ2_9BACT|nr:MAG: hypothetical protein A2161_03190 [Candidatus Schekmanbacteria bacterium RBG_13_48_7]